MIAQEAGWLRYRLQGRAARRSRDGGDPDWSMLPRHPRRGGYSGVCGPKLPNPDALLMYNVCLSISIQLTRRRAASTCRRGMVREFYDTVEDIPLDE